MSVPQKILIVDDSEDQVLFTSQILEDHGYSYIIARNGNEALEAIRKERPALVLLDIMMPKKSGLNVLKTMRQDPSLESIPVIVVSGASQVTGVDIKTGQQEPKENYSDDFARDFGEVIHDRLGNLNPDGIIEKPISPPVMIAKIKKLLP